MYIYFLIFFIKMFIFFEISETFSCLTRLRHDISHKYDTTGHDTIRHDTIKHEMIDMTCLIRVVP
jgi:hypothetical protein